MGVLSCAHFSIEQYSIGAFYRHIASYLPHNAYYVVFYCLSKAPNEGKTHPFDLPSVLTSRCHNIDTGGLNATVSEDICQLCNILFNAVKGTGKELAEIMRKDLDGFTPAASQSPFICAHI